CPLEYQLYAQGQEPSPSSLVLLTSNSPPTARVRCPADALPPKTPKYLSETRDPQKTTQAEPYWAHSQSCGRNRPLILDLAKTNSQRRTIHTKPPIRLETGSGLG